MLNLITSAKLLLTDKVTVTGSEVRAWVSLGTIVQPPTVWKSGPEGRHTEEEKGGGIQGKADRQKRKSRLSEAPTLTSAYTPLTFLGQGLGVMATEPHKVTVSALVSILQISELRLEEVKAVAVDHGAGTSLGFNVTLP